MAVVCGSVPCVFDNTDRTAAIDCSCCYRIAVVLGVENGHGCMQTGERFAWLSACSVSVCMMGVATTHAAVLNLSVVLSPSGYNPVFLRVLWAWQCMLHLVPRPYVPPVILRATLNAEVRVHSKGTSGNLAAGYPVSLMQRCIFFAFHVLRSVLRPMHALLAPRASCSMLAPGGATAGGSNEVSSFQPVPAKRSMSVLACRMSPPIRYVVAVAVVL